MKLIGLDPGLRHTGWGIILAGAGRLRHVANGTVSSSPDGDLASRLAELHAGVVAVIREYAPDEAALEETFVNRNPRSTLKLGQARGVVLLAPAEAGIPVAEYAPNRVKKAVTGVGHAAKEQVAMMVATLLPGIRIDGPDAADALAVAICHAHYRAAPTAFDRRLAAAATGATGGGPGA